MKEAIKQKIDVAIYAYNPAEFMPIFEDCKLANRNDFIVYKAKSLLRRSVRMAEALGRRTIESIE